MELKKGDSGVKSEKEPNIAGSVYLAPGSVVIGDVTIGENSGIWCNSVVRGDVGRIVIGERTNIQDLVTVHTSKGYVCTLGNNVSVGHNAVIHGCTIGDNTLIGMGAIVMNGAAVGENCIIGAGALVTPGMKIPAGSVAVGYPAKIRRAITEEEIEHNKQNAQQYVDLAEEAKK